MPKRIQRKRQKGWRMPEGAIYVGRGTMWGNPFVPGVRSGIFDGIGGRPLGLRDQAEILIPILTLHQCIDFYRDLVSGLLRPEMYPWGHEWNEKLKKHCTGHASDVARIVLNGHDLACWCPLDQPCHADVLLEIANCS